MSLIRSPKEEDASKEGAVDEKSDERENQKELPKSFLGFGFGVVYPSITLMLVYFGYSAVISFVALIIEEEVSSIQARLIHILIE